MSRQILLGAALLAVFAAPSRAAGINLSWDDCGAAGVLQKNFACDTNTGSEVMIGSVVSPVPIGNLDAMAAALFVQTGGVALTPWWHLESSGCRAGTFAPITASFTGIGSCANPWSASVGGVAGGIDYQPGFAGIPNRARVRVVCAVPDSVAIDNTTEYFMFRITISHQKTLTCAGCSDGACILLDQIQLYPASSPTTLTIGNPLLRNFVVWQAGLGGTGSCPVATASRSSTWGSIKAMYR